MRNRPKSNVRRAGLEKRILLPKPPPDEFLKPSPDGASRQALEAKLFEYFGIDRSRPDADRALWRELAKLPFPAFHRPSPRPMPKKQRQRGRPEGGAFKHPMSVRVALFLEFEEFAASKRRVSALSKTELYKLFTSQKQDAARPLLNSRGSGYIGFRQFDDLLASAKRILVPLVIQRGGRSVRLEPRVAWLHRALQFAYQLYRPAGSTGLASAYSVHRGVLGPPIPPLHVTCLLDELEKFDLNLPGADQRLNEIASYVEIYIPPTIDAGMTRAHPYGKLRKRNSISPKPRF